MSAYGKSTDWGYYCVMYYSPIAQQTAHIIAAEKAIEPTTKNKHTDTNSNHTTYIVNGGSL